ncbi:hypothetical protein EW145_g8255 [Phellinidium pouzarii]|uniref:Mitochondrial intermembrane space import and assembly protein 40 n=1 Tax=Phellinidium pouzarii TaxID=167371 RepID=A0A4S4KCB4_9AGAM|nr:hypothetical protein EW145_g8255 [Phellinidium pouzarii]
MLPSLRCTLRRTARVHAPVSRQASLCTPVRKFSGSSSSSGSKTVSGAGRWSVTATTSALALAVLASGLLALRDGVRLDAPDDSKVKAETAAASASASTASVAVYPEPVSIALPASDAEDVPEANENEALTTDASADATADTDGDHGGGAAYNPETGEINWDCPCLGGMAHGPCGEDFRAAFSCFVNSEGEPKGIECVERFQAMQDCFRRHPEVYGEEIMSDDDEEGDQGEVETPTTASAEPEAAVESS